MDVSPEPQLSWRRFAVAPAPGDARAKDEAKEKGGHRGARYLRAGVVASFAVLLAACEARGPSAASKSASAPSSAMIRSSAIPAPAGPHSSIARETGAVPATSGTPAAIRCLVRIYGGVARWQDGKWYFETTSGAAIPYDDGRAKSLDEQLAAPDVEDAFRDRYSPGPLVPVTRKDFDPGRTRLIPLFAATYGATAREVQRSLVPVHLVSGNVSVHRRAADALRRVAAKLEAMIPEHPELKQFFEPLGGGFNWRTVAGTELQSAHSFGVAVDLNPSLGAYWRWQNDWQNKIPPEIVSAFEREGFVWGGRWFHFDTMHFEFRPELFDDACYENPGSPRL